MDTFGLDFADPEEEGDEIIPAVNNEDIQYRSRIIVINSADRNKDKYPKPNNYTVNFVEDFFDVTELTLLDGTIPASQYNLNDNNNVLYFSESINPVNPETNERYPITNSQIITEPPFPGFNLSRLPRRYAPSDNGPEPIPPYVIGEGPGPNTAPSNNNNDNESNFPGLLIGKGFYGPTVPGININITPELSFLNVIKDLQDDLAFQLSKKMSENGLNDYKIYYNNLSGKYIFEAIPKEGSHIVYPYSFLFKGQKVNYGEHSYEKVIKRNIDGSIVYDEFGNKEHDIVYYGDTTHIIKPRAISRIIGFLNQNYNGLISGTVSADEIRNNILLGQNTHFLTDLKNNQYITLLSKEPNQRSDYHNTYYIEEIISDIELKVNTDEKDLDISIQDYECYSAIITPPFLRTLYPFNPVALVIPKCRRLFSINPVINRSYMLFQEDPRNKQNDTLYSDSNQTITKTFNPPQGKLSELTIRFFNTEEGPPGRGTLYDFGGRDHRLVFKVTMMAQSRKYYKGRPLNN